MNTDVETGRAEQDRQLAPFWLRPTSFWLPTHFPVSAWHTHSPFASWIVDVLRPRQIVELGTHLGFSCFAFAEAAKRLGLQTTINALDTFEGDDHAGFYGEAVFDYVTRVAGEDYPDSVRLMRGWFSESRPLIPDASVDLLHIDGRHAYEDVVTDYEEWRTAVRDGGVILFHDIAERQMDFGVWRLWEDLAVPGRSFTFEHGHGLGVLPVGDVSPAPLQAMFSADDATADRIRADFSRLGDVVARQAWLETLPEEVNQARAEIDQLSRTEAAHRAYIDSLRASTSWRVTAPLRAVGKLRPHRD